MLQAFAGAGPQSVRLILSAEPEQLRCVNDQGSIVLLGPAAGEELQGPGAEAEGDGAAGQDQAPAGLGPDEEEAEAGGPAAPADGGDGGSAGSYEALGPEFLAESGYRGVRCAASRRPMLAQAPEPC